MKTLKFCSPKDTVKKIKREDTDFFKREKIFAHIYLYTREMKMCLHKNLYTMFIAALLIIARKWKQS